MTTPSAWGNATDRMLAALRVLYAPGQVVELRVPKGGADGTISGFFNKGRELAQAAANLSGRYPGIYTTLNPLRAELLERSPNQLTRNADKGTLATDDDVTERRWMLVDVDPVRPPDVSSTQAERSAAFALAAEVTDWLAESGWPLPVLADSGNGAHLLYRVQLPNDDASKALVHGALKRLAQQFNTDALKIDTKVANASRICKVYGTVAAKGQATADRPHRAAEMLDVPAALEIVTPEQLAAMAPIEPATSSPAPLTPPAQGDDRVRKYVIAALDGAIRTISAAGPGTRNDTLNSEAYGVFRWAAGGFISRAMVWAGLEAAALGIGLERSEVNSTLHSAWDAAQKKPRMASDMPEPTHPQRRQARPVETVDPETGEILPAPAPDAANDNAAEPPLWGRPLDVFAEFPAPGVDLSCLPDTIAAYAAECGELIGVEPGMVALPAIVACAAALHDDVTIQPKRHESSWTESARLWCAIVGNPSVKKSPAIRRATKRLRKIDADLAEENARTSADYQDQLEQFKDAKKEARKTGEAIKAPERPRMGQMIVEDITVEKLTDVLADNARGVLCINDELSGWFGSMDAYSGGKAGNKDRAAWLQAYNGGFRRVDRVQRGTVSVPNFSVSMIGGIQPDSIRRIAKDMTDDGLMQRFMIIVGRNAREHDRTEDLAVTRAFGNLVDHLHRVQPSQEPVKLSEGAHQVREALMAYAAELADYPALPGGLRSHLGKWPGLFARLLLTYHAIECAERSVHPCSCEAARHTADRVDRLMRRFLLPHAMAYYTDILGAAGELEHARWVAGFVLARGLQDVTNRDLTQAYKQWRGLDDWRRQRVMQVLEDMGWLVPVLAADNRNRRGVSTWAVNPAVHALFAEQAADEAQRRTRLRDEIAAMQRAGRD